MDGTAKLAQSTLADSLNAACAAMAQYMAWDSETITENDIEALPDYVFNLAVAAKWLPNPPDLDDSWNAITNEGYEYLGDYLVWPTYREQFVTLIRKTLNNLQPEDGELHRLRRAEQRLREIGLWTGPEQCDDEWLKKNLTVTPGPSPDAPNSTPKRPRNLRAIALMDRWHTKTGESLEELARRSDIKILTLHRIRAGTFSYSKQTDSLKVVAAALEVDGIPCEWQDLLLLPHPR
jgi:hypothetical protein